ncbi:alpha/beta hydrolase-fold protein [Fulvivirga sedimenti]|uniref:Alpha/beta hydrolase n=1 Tax=Fulvivirga sedimenti TaxID=2879465 RepID=A0A9X1HP15_9BACT|nr:alpha/beta hydrolase-fold protein [Fulvivirga sedimenti]MCA6073724.1 hypothetical protein [Fulvivirga sedimenti]
MKTRILFLLLLIIPAGIQAQDPEEIIIGEKLTVHSNILNEDRKIWISTPESYEGNTNLYPVMYLLDGDGHFHHTTGIVQFLSSNGIMPEMIIVGITNTDRTRDMTPALDEPDSMIARMSPTAGGADNFLAFIRDELMPFINKEYRTAPYKILVGHSLGGLVAAHTLITQPELFNAYIAISPSLWYGNQSLIEPAEKMLTEREELNVSFFMTIGDEGGSMLGGAMKLAALFEEHPISGFEHKFIPMPEESHGSIPHRSTYQGLEFIYNDFQPPLPRTYEEFQASLATEGASGLMNRVSDHYSKLSKKYGYMVSDEATINQLGYIFMQEQRMDDALLAFRMNTEKYPDSANAFDSLGDGYRAAGDSENAIESYKKAVSLAKKSGHPVGAISAVKLAEVKAE